MRENEQDEDHNYESICRLIHAIKQERLNPELLKYEKEVFEEIRDLLEDQRGKLKDFLGMKDKSQGNVSNLNFKYMIYNAEIQKIEYLLKTYLKSRLKKIQTFCFQLIKDQQETEKLLSQAQLKFLRKYVEFRYQYFKDNALKILHKGYRDFKGIDVMFAKNEEEQRGRRLLIESKQSKLQLKTANKSEHVFAEIITNPKQLRFGLDLHASNTNTEQMEVVSPGSIIFGPYQQIIDRFEHNEFKLI